MQRTYNLSLIADNHITITVKDGGGVVERGFELETCPSCRRPMCCIDCDGSEGADDSNEETEADAQNRILLNQTLNTIERLLVAHAVAGINIEDTAYVEGVNTVLEAVSNEL